MDIWIGVAVTVSVKDREVLFDWLSVAATVNVAKPAADGVPESKPAWDRVNPVGKLPPAMLNAIGAAPPVAAIVAA